MTLVKIFLKLILWAVALSILAYGYKNIPLQKIGEEFSQKIYVEKNNAKFSPDWTNESVLSQINSAREDAGLMKVKINDKLNQAARSRLSVITTDDDYSGAITGLTRELAIKNAGYSANYIGDLLLLDFFKSNDPIENWSADKTTKDTLFHTNFREVGIAVKNEEDKVNVYVMLVSPQRVVPVAKKSSWGGPDLWEAVNKKRVEMGVNPLSKKDELCTLASIRLNQLLELGKLDGHAGFVPLLERADLKWIAEKYNISEYLAAGYQTPEETVNAWVNTLSHRTLLSGGEYVWGCVYAQDSYAVAMAAY